MKKFDILYEGILDKIGKGIGRKIRGAGETVAKGIEKGAKGAEKLAAKTPFLGSISKANKAVGRIEAYFNDIQKDMNDNRESLAKLKGKADSLLNKLIDIFGDDPDKEVVQLMRKLEDRSNAIADMFQDLSTLAKKSEKGATSTDYKEPAPEDKPENNIRLKKQKLQFNSYQHDEKSINEAIDFIDVTCDEIDQILKEMGSEDEQE